MHTSVDFGIEDQITVFEDQFIDSCMRIIRQQKEAIEARSEEERHHLSLNYADLYKGYKTNSKLKKILPVQEKRIIACLSYLKMLVYNSEKDGMHGLIPHAALNQGSLIENIIINNTYEGMTYNGHRSRF